MHICMPYLSIINPGSYTRRGSNIHQVVQQNKLNKRLRSLKHWVPQLLKFNKQ